MCVYRVHVVVVLLGYHITPAEKKTIYTQRKSPKSKNSPSENYIINQFYFRDSRKGKNQI